MKNFNSVYQKIILVIVIALNVSFAQQQLYCSEKDGSIFFGNGIMTLADDAFLGMMELQNAISQSMNQDDYDAIEFNVAYNPTSGAIMDIFESAIQDLSTDASEFWKFWFDVLPMPQSLRDMITVKIAQLYNSPSIIITDALQNHITIYKRHILEGKKVLLVAHSQGTFYANQSYTFLTNDERASFGITSVALMDSYVAGNYPYITLTNDLAVSAVRAAKALIGVPGPLPSNVTNTASVDWMGHSFESEYLMYSSNSRTAIVATAINVYYSLAQPSQTASDGIITVTLTWGSEPDVDLHVFEPTGYHVYYAAMSGVCGYLDVDDVTSWGPEHYYVSCEALQAGTFQVGVNYYHGYAPETAKINIRAGLIERNFEVFLSSPRYSSGNSSPIPVANISVTGDDISGFTFNVN